MASNKYFNEIDIEFVEDSTNYTKVVAEPFKKSLLDIFMLLIPAVS